MDHGEQLAARDNFFHFNENPKDVAIIMSFFLDVMLYQPLTAREIADLEQDSENQPKYPGLSPIAVEEVTNKGKVEWTTSKLKDVKVRMKIFLWHDSNIFNFRIFIIAWYYEFYFDTYIYR
jgi:proteasome component ECM29